MFNIFYKYLAKFREIFIKIWANFNENDQTLEGSFSSVSTPNFARKYSLESSWRDLQDLHASASLRPQYFSKISSIFWIFRQFLQNLIFFIEFCSDFDENFSEFRRIFVKNVEHSTFLTFLDFWWILARSPLFWENSNKISLYILREYSERPNSDLKSSNGSVPRRSNLST